MLVLSRKLGEKITIGDRIVVTVVKLGHGQVRLGIEAPRRSRPSARRSVLASTPPSWCNRSSEGNPLDGAGPCAEGRAGMPRGTEACHPVRGGHGTEAVGPHAGHRGRGSIASPPGSCHRPAGVAPAPGKVGLRGDGGCRPLAGPP
jgi:hypothetical protein